MNPRLSLALVALTLLVTCTDPPLTSGPPPDAIVKLIVDRTQLIGGAEASGRVGDFILDNGRARFIVQGLSSPSGWSSYGGALIDLDLAGPGRGDDRLKELFFQCGLRSFAPDTVEIADPGGPTRPGILRLTGHDAGFPYVDATGLGLAPPLDVPITIDYVLAPGGRTLEIRVGVLDTAGLGSLACGPVLLPGDTLRTFLPGRGFVDEIGIDADFVAEAPPDGRNSYVLYRRTGRFAPSIPSVEILPLITEARSTLEASRYDETFFISVGDGDVDSALAERRRVLNAQDALVGLRVDLAPAPGREEELRAQELVLRDLARGEEFQVLSAARALDGQTARFRVPTGRYAVELRGSTHEGGRHEVELTASATVSLALAPGGFVALYASEADASGRVRGPTTAHLSIMAGADAPAEAERVKHAYLRPGDRAALPAGRYTGYVTRGPEYDRVRLDFSVADGATTTLSATVTHVVTSPGWVHTDLHLHSTVSSDSQVPMRERALGAVGEGLDVLLSTEHDSVVDYAPTLEALSLGDAITPEQGCEVSPIYGHTNAWPIAPTPVAEDGPERPLRNWPVWWFEYTGTRFQSMSSPTQVFERMRAVGATMIQANHPRSSQGIFRKVRYVAATGTTTLPLPAYDAFEIANGPGGNLQEGLDDLFGLLQMGRRITVTGVSDSHRFDDAPGYSRTLIASPVEHPRRADLPAVWAALKAGRAIVSNGPFITLEASAGDARASLGDTLKSARGPVRLHVRVEAPAWIDTRRVRLVQNGVVIHARDISAGPAVERADFTVTATPTVDAAILAIVEGEQPVRPIHGAAARALTNPLYVDVDGAGFAYGR